MFASTNCFFVPNHRQITVFLEHRDAETNTDAIAVFTQLENVDTNHTLDINGREVKLDLEILDDDARLPADELTSEWIGAITENIGRYLKQGVITSQATRGEIAVDSLGNGQWLFTRGKETVLLDNSKHLPGEDNQYWVAYTSGCNHCGDTPDFEFVAVKSSNLDVPEGVSLGEHLRPFVEAMEAEARTLAKQDSEENGLMSVLGKMPGFGAFLKEKLYNHVTTVYDIRAGKGEVFTGERKDEIGGVRIDGTTVLSIRNGGSLVFDRLLSSPKDGENSCDIVGALMSRVIRDIEKLQFIEVTDITPELFPTAVMDRAIRRAMLGDYQYTNRVEHQLYHTARSVATPGKRNWWLRILVNAWFMHFAYPREDVMSVAASQVKEIGGHLDIGANVQEFVIAGLSDVINDWY